ncbi:MAG: hypothetical protein ACREAY_09415 [Nitrososphaera sp.]|uniref:hypothetical protein n=1 Tax=Nitrososphaera sp. TaxID=1971748 RepID=UPI003D6DB83C
MIPSLTLVATKSSESPKRILVLDPQKFFYRGGDEEVIMQAVKAGDLEPNSFIWFLDPFGKTMVGLGSESDVLLTLDKKEMERFEKRDAFENYMLIRLPEWLGGGQDDVSAFRSYHAVSLSDNCLSRYWPAEGRWRIENPCAGDIYRPWDGLAVAGPASGGYVGGTVSRGHHPALQELRLAVDSQGYIIAFRPDNSLYGDGVQGNGKALSPAALKESNNKLIAAASQYAGYPLPFLTSIPPDYDLSDLYPAPVPWWLKPASPKPPMEATYSNYREYGAIIMDVYPIEDFPELELGGPLVSSSADSGYLVNSTLASALMPLDYYYRPSGEIWQVRNGTDIAGDYAILIAPAESKDGDYPGAGVLIWGMSAEGKKDLLGAMKARNMTIDELVSLARGIGIVKAVHPAG